MLGLLFAKIIQKTENMTADSTLKLVQSYIESESLEMYSHIDYTKEGNDSVILLSSLIILRLENNGFKRKKMIEILSAYFPKLERDFNFTGLIIEANQQGILLEELIESIDLKQYITSNILINTIQLIQNYETFNMLVNHWKHLEGISDVQMIASIILEIYNGVEEEYLSLIYQFLQDDDLQLMEIYYNRLYSIEVDDHSLIELMDIFNESDRDDDYSNILFKLSKMLENEEILYTPVMNHQLEDYFGIYQSDGENWGILLTQKDKFKHKEFTYLPILLEEYIYFVIENPLLKGLIIDPCDYTIVIEKEILEMIYSIYIEKNSYN